MKVVLYTSGCPKCKVLAKKLTDKHIDFVEFDDLDFLASMDIKTLPVLGVETELLTFGDAVRWINAQPEVAQ